MRAHLKWSESMRFIGGSSPSHRVIIDGSIKSAKGILLDPSPIAMLSFGIGGYTICDAVTNLERMLRMTKAVVFELKNVSLPADKLCCASLMRVDTPDIIHEFRVVLRNASPCLPTSLLA